MVVCQCQRRKLGELFGTTDVVNSDSFLNFKSCKRDSILARPTQFKTIGWRVKGFKPVMTWKRHYKKKTMESEYSAL